MKTLIKSIFIFLLILFSFNKKAFSQENIKIGLIVPLSGEYKEIGQSIVKATRLAINKINDSNIEIYPKDTKADPHIALKVSEELYKDGIKIIIGPVFNQNLVYLNKLSDVIFLSLTNKLINNPNNVISTGINALSQINTIKKYLKKKEIKKTVFMIPNSEIRYEVEKAISESKIKLKQKFYYNTDPTVLTAQIEDLTYYGIRKQNLIDEITRLENSNETNKEKKIEKLKKKDTLGGINFDSVIIADFDESLKSVTTSLLYTDVSSKRIHYICLNQWFDKSLLKEKFIYDTDPTILTSQIEDLTYYEIRKQNLEDEILRLQNSNEAGKEKKIETLKKRDTLGGINFDSVIIADFDESLKSVATSLLYTDVTSKRIHYICLNQWFDKSLLKEENIQPIYFPSINKKNYDKFIKEYNKIYGKHPNQLSFLSYDLIGLVYFLIYKNDFIVDDKIFYKKNKFKGKIGIFEISENKITHSLNFYSVENKKFKEIF